MKAQKPTDRLNYSGELEPIIKEICTSYDLGSLIKFFTIDVGYEDCNVFIETAKGKFIAKMFSKIRTPDDIQRYVSIMQEVIKAGVSHPEIYKNHDGQILSTINDVALVIMRFIDGKTFLELDRAPDEQEMRDVIAQAIKINRINYHPPYLFDSWAIPNINKMFDKVAKYILPADLILVNQAINIFSAVKPDDLPHCFVHGDFTKANILKGDDEKIYILDFSVSNWYSRIQELAVIAANLMHDNTGKNSLKSNCEIIGLIAKSSCYYSGPGESPR